MQNDNIKAKVGYMFFAYINNPDLAYDKIMGINGATNNHAVLDDMQTCVDFLYGDNVKFPCRRCVFDNYDINVQGGEVSDCHVVASVFASVGICEVGVYFTLENTNADELVYLRQLFLSSTFVCGNKSIMGIADDIFIPLGTNSSKAQIGYMVEINKWNDFDEPDNLFSSHSDKLYGVLTGDEGYSFVPSSLYETRMANNWSSRNFVKAVVYRNNFMLINFNKGDNISKYHNRQNEFGGKYYNGANPYFFMDCQIAGVNHGMMLSCETGLIAKTISENVLENKFSSKHNTSEKTRQEIQYTKSLRKELIIILNKLENIVQIAELGELDKLVIDGLEITSVIDKMKYLLELLESELDLLYQTSTNRLVNTLTILGLVLAFLQLVAGMI